MAKKYKWKWVKLAPKEKEEEVTDSELEIEINSLTASLKEMDPTTPEYGSVVKQIHDLTEIRNMQADKTAKIRKFHVDGGTLFMGLLSTGQLVMTMIAESKGIVIPNFISKMILPLWKKPL